MKKSDISDEQFRRAATFCVEAFIQLRDEYNDSQELPWWDDEFRNLMDERLFFGPHWRRVAKIHSVEDARREILAVADRWSKRRTNEE